MTDQRDRDAAESQCDACKVRGLNRTHTCHSFLAGCAHVRSEPEASDEQRARTLVRLAVKDHDDGGYAFAGMYEILEFRIAQALADARREGEAKEREAAAKLCEKEADRVKTDFAAGKMKRNPMWDKDLIRCYALQALDLANAIRAHGSKP